MNIVTPEEVGLSSERLARIRSALQTYVDQQKTAGLITLVARHGKVAQLECIGQMDIEAGKPMQPDAFFRIYSMTKPITSVAVMMLVEQGKLLLSDPLSKYVPAFKDAKVYCGDRDSGKTLEPQDRAITVHDLLRHTSGLGYGIFEDSSVEDLYRQSGIFAPPTAPNTSSFRLQVSLEEMARRVAELPLENQPGARWRYSIATDMLGYLVGLISGIPFDAFLAEEIFKPLGMNETCFCLPLEKLGRFTACYMPALGSGAGLALYDSPTTSTFLQADVSPSGGTGLVSTAGDYLRFSQMLLNRGELDGVRLVSRKTVELMTANHISGPFPPPISLLGSGFGLGFEVRTGNESGLLGSVGAYGWYGAADTAVRIDPREDLTMLYLAQSRNAREDLFAYFQNMVYQAIVD